MTNNRRFTDITSGNAWVFSVLCVLAMASTAQAQQPTSQVLAFSGAIPGQPDGPVALRLRLHDADAAGSLLFEETQTVMVVDERFTVRVGDATVDGVPATLFRDNASLWMAFALDSAPDIEIGARTALTSGGYAHAAVLVAGPMVRTLNGLVGDVALAEGPNVTITPSGNTLTIAAPNALTGVTHDSTLSGEGTGGAPLGVRAPLQLMSNSGAPTLAGSNGGAGSGVRGTSTMGTGVFGTGGEGPGVLGSSSTGFGTGVRGISTSGTGIRGDSTSGTGVEGHNTFTALLARVAGMKGTAPSENGTGVWGEGGARGLFGFSPNGSGVVASGGQWAGFFDGRVAITGSLELRTLGAAGSTPLCRHANLQIGTCASSLRYKTDVLPFGGGLDIVNRLRPIAFTWTQGGLRDVGLAAEDVEQVEPRLTFRNDQGEIEGVKYDQLSAVFVNAFAEQQAQIQQQQEQIKQQQDWISKQQRELAALKQLVCLLHPNVDACK